MNKKTLFPILIIASFVIITSKSMAVPTYSLNFSAGYDLTIGSKVNDTTATVSITNAGIQQSIMSLIPLLSGRTISNAQPSISVTGGASYLIFQAIAPSGARMNVALRLTLVSNSYLFQPSGNKNVFVCNASNDCATCFFIKDQSNNIIGCSTN